MRTSIKSSSLTRLSFLGLLLLFNPFAADSFAQQRPLVYDVENTGAQFPRPPLPSVDQLPIVPLLTDPFEWSDGSGRDTRFASWSRRRAQIKAEIENYEIGPKPDCSDCTITAVYANGVLTVDVLRNTNGRTLRLTSTINLPSGTAPAAGFPAVIQMALAPSSGTGGLPAGIASIDYIHDDVTQYAAGQQISHAGDPYFLMYPEYNAGPCPPAGPCGADVGQYSAWSWGVSRLIDGMQIAKNQLVNPLPIDISHLAVHGCSYAGKMALFAGAFDERIALTFAQESGGGGAPAWRVSHAIEPDGTVEKSNNTDGSWFKKTFKTQFGRADSYKLPEDHHELMAMVAPRALLVTGNTDFVWLSNRSAYVTARATQKVYETFGIGDRFGFYVDGGHGHCAVPADQTPTINAFYSKFLLGQDVNTDVHVYPQTVPFTTLDYAGWTQWWDRPPVLSIPSDLNVEATAANGAVVTFTGSAHDGVSGNDLQVTFTPASGSVFSFGSTTVTATATDASGSATTGSFVVTVSDTTPPVIASIADQTVEATGPAGAPVAFAAGAYDVVSGQLPVIFSPPSGSTFALGTTTVTATATDQAGNASSRTFVVNVRDTTAPNFGSLTASPNIITSRNHQMVPVSLTASVVDAVDQTPVTRIISVASNEPVSGTGGGDLSPDWEITGPLTLKLRGESSGKGSGRVYTITVESRDYSGNARNKTVAVSVPRN